MTRQLENRDLVAKLKKEVLQKWIRIRAPAFLKAWLAIQRQASAEATSNKKRAKSTTPSEVSMRKGLPVKPCPSGLSEPGSVYMRKSLSKRKSI